MNLFVRLWIYLHVIYVNEKLSPKRILWLKPKNGEIWNIWDSDGD